MFRIRFHGRGGQGMKTASRNNPNPIVVADDTLLPSREDEMHRFRP